MMEAFEEIRGQLGVRRRSGSLGGEGNLAGLDGIGFGQVIVSRRGIYIQFIGIAAEGVVLVPRSGTAAVEDY